MCVLDIEVSAVLNPAHVSARTKSNATIAPFKPLKKELYFWAPVSSTVEQQVLSAAGGVLHGG